MKQITLLQGKSLLIELPEGVRKTIAYGLDANPPYIKWMGKDGGLEEITLPPGNWRIIGMLSEVTGEQADKMVRKVTLGYWFDYEHPNKRHDYMCTTPIKSLESAILAEGYLLESPPTPKCGCFGPAEEGACPACDEWVESQSRTLDPERTLIIEKI